MTRGVRPALHEHRREPAVCQVHRGREAGGSGPGDQDLNPFLFFLVTVHAASSGVIFL
jgi:hypothetical protein